MYLSTSSFCTSVITTQNKNTLPQQEPETKHPIKSLINKKITVEVKHRAQFASNLNYANNALWTIVLLRLLIPMLVATWVSASLSKQSDLGDDTTGTTADSVSIPYQCFYHSDSHPVIPPPPPPVMLMVVEQLGLPSSWRCLLTAFLVFSSVGPWQ